MADTTAAGRSLPNVVSLRPPKPKYKVILAIDGGGVRGIVPTMVLLKLEELIKQNLREKGLAHGEFNVNLADYFDCIAGTSIGSIIGLYLATKGEGARQLLKEKSFQGYEGGAALVPGTAKSVEALFRLKGNKFFPPICCRDSKILGIIRSMLGPRFNNQGLKTVLNSLFEDKKLSDCRTSVVVPTFELATSKPVDFWAHCDGEKSLTGFTAIKVRSAAPEGTQLLPYSTPDGEWLPDREFTAGKDFLLREVAAASAAFPGMFPSIEIKHPDGSKKDYVDGGLIASNPTMSALSLTKLHLGIDLEKTAVLSLGCGVVFPNRAELKGAGMTTWVTEGRLVSLLLDQKSEYVQSIVDSMYYKVLEAPLGQYTRVQLAVNQKNNFGVDTDALGSSDNPAMIDSLMKIGQELAEKSTSVLKKFVDDFLMVSEKGDLD